jgi:hypothetical protein
MYDPAPKSPAPRAAAIAAPREVASIFVEHIRLKLKQEITPSTLTIVIGMSTHPRTSVCPRVVYPVKPKKHPRAAGHQDGQSKSKTLNAGTK